MAAQLGDFGDDNRAGIDRTLHRISCMRNRDGRIVGLTCRAGRAVPGSAAMAADLVASGKSILFMVRCVAHPLLCEDFHYYLSDGVLWCCEHINC